MKKQSAFVNIPTLPKTFSGQWMTFSHMANHYRKLLSVKPRVDTGVPKNAFTSISSMSGKQSSNKQLKGFSNNGSGGGGGSNGHLSKTGTGTGTGVYRERLSTTGTMEKVPSRTKTKSSRPKMASRMLDYEYHALSNGLMNSPNGSFNAGSSSDGYQVVFGPSSIKSSVDAMISDPDPDPEILVEPKLSSISIGEKIRKFLDHIHAQETQQQQQQHQTQSQHKIGGRPLLGSRERRDPSIMVGSHTTSKEQLLAAESRHGHGHGHGHGTGTGTGRHSKCFTPFEVPGNKGTKKRSVKSASASSHQPQQQQQQQFPRSPRPQQPLRSIESRKNFNNINNVAKDNNTKDSPTKLSTLIRNHKKLSKNSASHKNKSPFQEMLTSLKQSANNHNHISDSNNNNNNSSGYNSIKKQSRIKSSAMSPTLSPRSVSVGTIRGSDELTEDFLLPGSSAIGIGIGRNMSTSTIQIDTGDMPTDWLKERVERGVVRINNAYFSLAPGTSTSSLGISSSMHPNKDSSRDSAYGFSSGESRITTRESTPEKKSNNNNNHSNNSNKISIKGYSHPRHNHHHHHHSRGSSSPGTHPNGTGIGTGTGPGTGYSSTSESTHNHNHHGNNNGKYKSSLSTVASSINQDRSSSNSHSHSHGVDLELDVHSSGHSSAASEAEKSIRHPFPQRPTPSYEELLREQKYMEFLTGVTDDIVLRGIYTNKGIKNIFKSHLMKSNELEMDKMLCLLERLRIDMGVPKDDSLNQLDFGYGSVDYSAGPYFYNGNGHPQDLSNTNAKSPPSSSSSSSPHHHHQGELSVGVERPASGTVTTTTTTIGGRGRDRSRSQNRVPADPVPVDVDIETGGTDSEEPQLVALAGVGQSSRIRKLSYTIERDDNDNNESVDFCSSELNIT